jgi:hypothetical protein
MEDRNYYIKISPEFISGDIFKTKYLDPYTDNIEIPFCCDITTSAVTKYYTGDTYVYSSMTDVLSGGTGGISILTGLTIPIFLTETAVDVGYYSVFDGMLLQKETMTNFLFSATTGSPYTYYFYNTSDVEFKKYLEFSSYYVDWGDGHSSPVTSTAPNYYSHTYFSGGNYTISMSGMSPWGSNVVKKTITVPYSGITATDPKGTAYFTPAGGNWSGTSLMYDYIFSGDESCDTYLTNDYTFTTTPFLVTGYTKSSLNDLQVYGKSSELVDGKFRLNTQITGTTGIVGTYYGKSNDGLYTSYSINGMDYYDYNDGTTLFAVYSSGITPDMVICSAITKNEVLLNVIDEPEVQSNIFIERGKLSGLERLERMGEIDSLGDLEKYGYGFFNVIKI